MNTLPSLKQIWSHMVVNMEAIRSAINERTVICGDGISGRETPGGITISLTAKSEQPADDPMDGAWVTVDVMDGSCRRTTIQVWAKTV